MCNLFNMWGTTAYLFISGIIQLTEKGKDVTVGVTEGTNGLRKQSLHSEKLTSDESRVIFTVVKRRKKEKYDRDDGDRMVMASILLAKPFVQVI